MTSLKPPAAEAQGRIVVVDDSWTILEQIRACLAERGYDVRTTTSPDVAVRLLRGADLTIIDFHMPGLNGTDYMLYAQYDDTGQPQYPLQWDHDAIAWLQENVQGTPVIAEAAAGVMNVPLYHWASRISINTGLPTILGWDWHQRQQRSILPGWEIDQRLQDVASLYGAPDQALAQSILDRYNVKYVVVGNVERAHYTPEGIAKFDAMVASGQLKIAYQNEGTTIYEVVR